MEGLQHFNLEFPNGEIRPFAGRIVRGRVVWPDRDLPYLNIESLERAGLSKVYNKALAEFESGIEDAIWNDPCLMKFSFEPNGIEVDTRGQ